MKQKSFLKKLVFSALIFFSAINLIGQNYSKTWYMDRKAIDFTTATPTINALPIGGSGIQHVSNGAYGNTNNLLFFVQDNVVYDRFGGTIAIFSGGTSGNGRQGPEMIITQVPGSCDNYYIIYTRYEQFTGSSGVGMNIYLVYAQIDMSMNSGLGGVVVQDVPIGSVFPDPSYITIALSKLNSGARSLYIARGWAIGPGINLYRYSVTSSGITFAANWSFSTPAEYTILEMDLSPDQSMLALPNCRFNTQVGPDVTIFYLTPSTGNLNPFMGTAGRTSISIDPNKQYTGVEFTPDNSALYVGVKNLGSSSLGIKRITNLTGVPIVGPFLSGSTLYGNSQIETAYDASGVYRLYAAKSTTDLGSIDPVLNTFTGGAITSTQPFVGPAYSGLNPYVEMFNPGFFQLPDQQDDENYDDRFVGSIPINCCLVSSAFTVNSYTANTTNGFSTSTTQTWTPTSNPFLYAYNLLHSASPLASLSTITVSNQLVIPANFNIAITGMRFEYKPRTSEVISGSTVIHYGARAIVQNTLTTKGQLTLNSTTFTSYDGCGVGMWEGIEVWGNTLQNQIGLGTSQGRLNVNSGSVISNAYCGVYAGKKNTLYSIANPVTNTSGSIIVTKVDA